MPNIRIRFHPAAAAEVEAAVQWYAERSLVAARAFAAEVNACVERVGEALSVGRVMCTVRVGISFRTFLSVWSIGSATEISK